MSTKYKLRITGECKQNLKLCKRRGLPMDELWAIVDKLLNGEQLEEKYRAHPKWRPQRSMGMPHTARLAAHLGNSRPRAYTRYAQHRHTFRPV